MSLWYGPLFGQHIVLRDSTRKQMAIMPGIAQPSIKAVRLASIPKDQYTRCFGFFCRQELKMQKAHIPVAFRLGSMEMANRLEGKGH